MKLSTGAVAAISGINQGTLETWVVKGIARPTVRGKGHGTATYFDLMGTLALTYGNAIRTIGIGSPLIEEIIAYLSGTTEEELLGHFASGETTPYPTPFGIVWLNPKDMPPQQHVVDGWVDDAMNLEKCLAHVKAEATRLAGAFKRGPKPRKLQLKVK